MKVRDYGRCFENLVQHVMAGGAALSRPTANFSSQTKNSKLETHLQMGQLLLFDEHFAEEVAAFFGPGYGLGRRDLKLFLIIPPG